MTEIHLQTSIRAPIEVCFDLSRSVDIHLLSTSHTKETVVAGRSSGLCETGDRITWRAKHFGFFQELTVELVKVEYPDYFLDQQVKGAFRSFEHHHYFNSSNADTIMTDHFHYSTPFGIAGKFFDHLVLERYMTNLLRRRNKVIKDVAESCRWRQFMS